MLGALIGDVVGSRFEFKNFKSREFLFFAPDCHPTDDSLMTLAVAEALVLCRNDDSRLAEVTERCMHRIARRHPNVGWGGRFYQWVFELNPANPYSLGNGAGMRISPVGWVADSEEKTKELCRTVTEITHGHPEGLLGAEAIAIAIYMARTGRSKEEIYKRMITDYYPEIDDFTLDKIRPNYEIDDKGLWVTCRGSIPQALRAFFEADGFESTIRNAISIGGDADTIAAMAGSVAEAYYGVPQEMEEGLLKYLSEDLLGIYNAFSLIKKGRVAKSD